MSEADSALGAILDTPAAEPPEVLPDTTTDAPVEAPPQAPEPAAPEPELEPALSETPEEEPKPSKNFATEAARIIRELSDTNPDKAALLRQMKAAIFRDISYKNQFDTPESAARVKATFEAIGGDEGLVQLQETAEAMRHVDEQAQSGSPELIDAWSKESPEGFQKALPYALQKIEQMSPEAYNRIMTPHLIKSLWATNIDQAIKNLESYAIRFANADFTADVNGMRQWLNGLLQSYRQYDQQQNDPREAQFREREAQFAKQEADLLEQRVRGAVQADIERSIEDSFKQHDRNGIFKGEARMAMLREIADSVKATMGADKGYQATLATLLRKGDIEPIAKYVKSKVDEVRGKAAREVWLKRAAPFQRQPRPATSRPENGATPAPAANGAKPAKNIPLPIAAKPDHTELDWSRDPTRYEFINGRGYLKSNGRYVTWRKAN